MAQDTSEAPQADTSSEERFGYPRPQLRRGWTCLNGLWTFAIDREAQWNKPGQVEWQTEIEVPFAPETAASKVEDTGFFKACWYRRAIQRPPLKRGERLILHFGAVDYQATVWVNGVRVGDHQGGYTPFSCDITDSLRGRGEQIIVVRAHDDPHDMDKPRGKQDWKLAPHAIWYPRTSGIWQTVWTEIVPRTFIESLRWNSSVKDWCLELTANVSGARTDVHSLRVTVTFGGEVFARDTYCVKDGTVGRRIALRDPGIADARNDYTWHPDHPHLFDVQLQLVNDKGRVVDSVCSYAALREIACSYERALINGEVLRMRLALDQGYWADSGMTATDAQLKRDVELAKEAGFNGVRKHQKIESPRFMYWADKLGLLVWQEMPSAYSFSERSMKRVLAEWTAAIERDYSHPSLVVRVPINESWMVPDLPLSAAQRDFVRALYYMTKAADPGRPVVCNSGWEAVLDADIVTIHDYDCSADVLSQRYAAVDENFRDLFERVRPGGKSLLLDGATYGGKVIGIDEMGGVKLDLERKGEASWGYSEVRTGEELVEKFRALLGVFHGHRRISIWCWTQLTDTYQEKNGLFTMDRQPKAPLDQLRNAAIHHSFAG